MPQRMVSELYQPHVHAHGIYAALYRCENAGPVSQRTDVQQNPDGRHRHERPSGGYYCTESSEHNAEYNPFYIKARYPELIDRFNIPLDEYPRRCIRQIAEWDKEYADLSSKGVLPHERSKEYASRIIEAMVTGRPYKLGGNVLNTGGLIENLPREACVEVPCLVDGAGVAPCYVGRLPVQLAAMNQTHVNVHLLTIEAAATKKREHIYHAAMLEPHTAAELSLIEAHGSWLPQYR